MPSASSIWMSRTAFRTVINRTMAWSTPGSRKLRRPDRRIRRQENSEEAMLDKVDQPSGLQAFGMYINGASVGASNGKIMESLNPYSGKPWATVPDGSKEDINAAVAAARAAFDHGPWSEMTATQRAALLRKL